MSSNTPAIRPHVEIINGQSVTSSLKIADHFGKNHKDVLRAIEQLDCSPAFRERNFAPTSARVPMPNGGTRQIPAYTITRDGFTFLAMGFTGKEAAQWKEAYIDAFNRMEASLQTPIAPQTQKIYLIGLTAEEMAGQRVLMTFNEDGDSFSAKPIPGCCYVLTLDQIARGVGIGQDLPFSPAQLTQIIAGASTRLHRLLMRQGMA